MFPDATYVTSSREQGRGGGIATVIDKKFKVLDTCVERYYVGVVM